MKLNDNGARHTILTARTIKRMAAYIGLQLIHDARGRFTVALPVQRYAPIKGTVGKRGGPLYRRVELKDPITVAEIEAGAAQNIAEKGEAECQKEFDEQMAETEKRLKRLLLLRDKSHRITSKVPARNAHSRKRKTK